MPAKNELGGDCSATWLDRSATWLDGSKWTLVVGFTGVVGCSGGLVALYMYSRIHVVTGWLPEPILIISARPALFFCPKVELGGELISDTNVNNHITSFSSNQCKLEIKKLPRMSSC